MKTENIIKSLKQRKINSNEIKKNYISGMDERHIKIIYRLSDEELSSFKQYYLSEDDYKKREENQKKIRDFRIYKNIDKNEDTEPKNSKEIMSNLFEAIKNVEKEEGEER